MNVFIARQIRVSNEILHFSILMEKYFLFNLWMNFKNKSFCYPNIPNPPKKIK